MKTKWWPIMTIGGAELLPWGHGYAYHMWDSMRARTAIIPLNFVLAAGRWLQRRLVYDWVPDAKRRDALCDAFVRGHREGVQHERNERTRAEEERERGYQDRYHVSIDAAMAQYLSESRARNG